MEKITDKMKRDNRHVIIFYLVMVALIILGMCVGCKTQQCVPEIIVRDSIRTEYSVKYDSIYQEVRDSVYIREKGDTVYNTRWRTEIRDKYVFKTDTVYQDRNVEVEKTEIINQLTKPQKGMIAGFWVLLVSLVLYIAIKIYLKFV